MFRIKLEYIQNSIAKPITIPVTICQTQKYICTDLSCTLSVNHASLFFIHKVMLLSHIFQFSSFVFYLIYFTGAFIFMSNLSSFILTYILSLNYVNDFKIQIVIVCMHTLKIHNYHFQKYSIVNMHQHQHTSKFISNISLSYQYTSHVQIIFFLPRY